MVVFFYSNVKDINSVLEVTVYDEDRDHRFEFLGTVSIPLLRIQNGLRKWYVLKDRKLRARAKGSNPQILLELNIIWNEVIKDFTIKSPHIYKHSSRSSCLLLFTIYIHPVACKYTNVAAQGK